MVELRCRCLSQAHRWRCNGEATQRVALPATFAFWGWSPHFDRKGGDTWTHFEIRQKRRKSRRG